MSDRHTSIGEGEGRSRAEMRLVMRAIREGWVIEPVVKRAVVARASRVLADPEAKSRDVARASNTLLAVERLALDAAREEDRLQRLDAGDATDRVEVMSRITDDQLRAVAASILPEPTPIPCLPSPADKPEPKRKRKRRG